MRTVNPVTTFKGALELGSPEMYGDALSFPIERYPYTKKAVAPRATRISVPAVKLMQEQQKTSNQGGQNRVIGEPLRKIGVKTERIFKIPSSEEDGIAKEVTVDDLERGYSFGSTIVPLSKEHEDALSLDTVSSFQIHSFIEKANFNRSFALSETSITIASKINKRAQIALSSLIHALYELDLYALARFVPRNGRPPIMLLLAPYISLQMEGLLDVQIPFAEDIRHYNFAPLDKVVTITGKVLNKHPRLPTEEMKQAMSDYVDAMDMDKLSTDQSPFFTYRDIFSPVIHRIQQIICFRALNPESAWPPTPEILLRYTTPNEILLSDAKSVLERLKKELDLKDAPQVNFQKRSRDEDHVAPISGLDINELLKAGEEMEANEYSSSIKQKKSSYTGNSQQIGLENPEEDFLRLLDDNDRTIEPIFKRMANVIREMILTSTNGIQYPKIISAISTLRRQADEWEEGMFYNDFVHQLRLDLDGDRLGSNHLALWFAIQEKSLDNFINSDVITNDTTDVVVDDDDDDEKQAF